MIFLLAFMLWLAVAIILSRAAQWVPGMFFVCYHVIVFIACLKIVETFL